MDELQLDKLTRASIELSEAASNYGALKVIFGVFLVFVMLIVSAFIVFVWLTLQRMRAIDKYLEDIGHYFSELNDHTIGSEEAKMVIEESLRRSEVMVKYYILKIRLENHLDNKKATQDKIRNVVENDALNRKVFLSRFVCKEHPVSFEAVQSDVDALAELMEEWVYRADDEFTVSLMANAVTIYFDRLCVSACGKIDGITN